MLGTIMLEVTTEETTLIPTPTTQGGDNTRISLGVIKQWGALTIQVGPFIHWDFLNNRGTELNFKLQINLLPNQQIKSQTHLLNPC